MRCEKCGAVYDETAVKTCPHCEGKGISPTMKKKEGKKRK